MVFMGQADKHGTEHREDVGLDEGHQHLEKVHEEQHDDAEGVQTQSVAHTHRPSEEDDAREAQDDGMAGHHVGEETDHQGEGLGEDAEELYHGHDGHGIGLEEQRHFGPEDFLPVLFVGKEVDDQHRAEGQEEGDVDVARDVATTGEDGQQAHHVGGEDEEEHRQQIRSVGLVVLLADGRLDEVVVYRHDEHLHHAHETFRRWALLVALLVPAGAIEEHGDEDDDDNPDLRHSLREAQVQGSHGGAVGHPLVDLTVSLGVEEELPGQRVGRAAMPAAVGRAAHDDGQGDAQVFALIRGDVPLVGIRQVFQDNLRDVQFFSPTLLFLCGELHGHEHQQQEGHQRHPAHRQASLRSVKTCFHCAR